MAQKLKEAGLEWEPQEGDAYHDSASDTIYYSQYPPLESANYIRFTWLARLDQLLAEIYKTYNFTLHSSGYIVLRKKGSGMVAEHFHSDTLENAAAEALLWIYERRNQHEG